MGSCAVGIQPRFLGCVPLPSCCGSPWCASKCPMTAAGKWRWDPYPQAAVSRGTRIILQRDHGEGRTGTGRSYVSDDGEGGGL